MSASPLKAFNSLEKLIANSYGQDSYEAILNALKPHKSDILESFKQWAPPHQEITKENSFGDEQLLHHTTLAVATLATSSKKKTQLPDWFLPYLELLPYLEVMGVFYPIYKACEHLPKATLKETLRDAPVGNLRCIATGLLGLAHDDQELVTAVITSSSFDSTDQGAWLLEHLGEETLNQVLAQVLDSESSRRVHYATLHALIRLQSSTSALPLVAALDHKDKEVQGLAKLGLTRLGADASDALEHGAKKGKKATKTWCKEALDLLATDAQASTPYPTFGFHALPLDERVEMIQTLDQARRDKPLIKPLIKKIKTNPTLWFDATISLFQQSPGRHDIHDLVGTLLFHPDLTAHANDFWAMYLGLLAYSSITDTSIHYRLMKHISRMPSSVEESTIAKAYFYGTGPFLKDLIPNYLSRATTPYPPLVYQTLVHTSKPLRAAALAAVKKLSSEDLAPVVELLQVRKKAVRLDVAKSLDHAPAKKLAPYKATLQDTWEKEAVQEIKDVLHHALQAL